MKQLELATEIPVGISYSGGTSSQWIVDAVLTGMIARPRNVAVFFADTGDEHEWTYEAVALTEERCRAEGLPFVRTATHRGETLSAAIMSACRGERIRVDNPPFWTENPGGGRGKLTQKCTQIWKTRAIRRAQAAWLKQLELPKLLNAWIGFGLDEIHRATKLVQRRDVNWVRADFPAIRMRKTRDAQRADVVRLRGRAPLFSMCWECPFASPDRIKAKTPGDLARATELDEAIRDGLQHVGVEEPCFVSDRLISVADVARGRGRDPERGPELSGCDAGACFL